MRNLQPKTTKYTGLLALTVFALFAACLLLVLLLGAGVYRRQTDDGLQSDTRRTVAQYLTTRVRQGDTAGAVAVEPFGEGQALVLTEVVAEEALCTRIYCKDGWLWELYTPASAAPQPEDGQRLLPVESLTFSLEHPRLTAAFADESGQVQQLVWCLRAQEEGQP